MARVDIDNPHRRAAEARKNTPINVGLIGLGNVGRGVAEYLQGGGGERFNVHLRRVAVSDPTRPRDIQVADLTGDAMDIIRDPKVDVVVEVMGGVDTARNYMLDAMVHGKSVVTANKAVMARHMREMLRTAEETGVDVGFEASVAGGVPIIGTLNRYRGDRVHSVRGVVNGTTNFMLTQMDRQGMGFDEAVALAQARGFAEADHSLDTGGFDSRDKLAILTMLMHNAEVDPETIDTRGIGDITTVDMDYAREHGFAVKLLSTATRRNGVVEMSVNPALLSLDDPLANIINEVNGVSIESELAGPQTFIGRGAGKEPTTSAVIGDILHVARNRQLGIVDSHPSLDAQVVFTAPQADEAGYIRANLAHRPGSLRVIGAITENHGVNVQTSQQLDRYQTTSADGTPIMPDIITFDPVPRRVINAVLDEMEQADHIIGRPFFMPRP